MRFIALLSFLTLAACVEPLAPVPMTQSDTALRNALFERHLREPESAKVRDVQTFQRPNGDRFICGLVNTKNGFGGYTGFQVFQIVSGPNIGPVLILDGMAAYNCAGAGYRA